MGSANPSRRATSVAIARIDEESRPPEKLTMHGGRASGASMLCANATCGSMLDGTSLAESVLRGRGNPAAISSGLSILLLRQAVRQAASTEPSPSGTRAPPDVERGVDRLDHPHDLEAELGRRARNA